MPRYRFRCDCGQTEEEYAGITQGPGVHVCPACRTPMWRDYQAEHAGRHIISEASIEKNRYPYLNHTMGENGPIRIESRAHEDALLKARGTVRDTPSAGAMYRFRRGLRTSVAVRGLRRS